MSTTTVTLEQAIANCSRRQERLDDVMPFFRKNARLWRRKCEGIVRSQGRAMKPDEIGVEEWESFLEGLVDLVRLWFVMPDEDGEGVDIDLRTAAGQRDLSRQPLTIAQLAEWVRGGQEGDPLGKHLNEVDMGRSPEEVAQRVFFAIRANAMTGESARKYLRHRAGKSIDGRNLLDALAAAWLTVMLPIIRKDWQAWVRSRIRL